MRLITAFLSLILLATLATTARGEEQQPSALAVQARMLTQRSLLVDTHIDVPYRLEEKWEDVTVLTKTGNFDYERARRGGLNIPFLSIYTPSETEAQGRSYALANRLIESVEALAGRAPKKFAMVRTPGQALQARKLGLMGLALGMENGSPLNGQLENVAFFRDRGVSYITLAHALSNHVSDSSYDENRPWGGLSPFGREVVAEMNRTAIMVDVSHISDDAFWQVLELSKAPVIASHSSARHFTPGWERNMSDDMIRALAAKGGVIMINFGSTFLTEQARQWYDTMKAARTVYLEENGLDAESELSKLWQEAYREDHPFPYATLDDLVAHFTHVIDLVGVQYVGIGSDFDGVGDTLPIGMKSVEDYPNLVEKFLEKGLSQDDIQAILGGNLIRVWQKVEDVAEELDADTTAG